MPFKKRMHKGWRNHKKLNKAKVAHQPSQQLEVKKLRATKQNKGGEHECDQRRVAQGENTV